MRTLEELQSAVSELENQIQALEGTIVSAGGLTIGDVVSVSKKLDSLKEELNRSKDFSSFPSRPVPYLHPYTAQPHRRKPAAVPASAEPRKSRITEGNIGRDVMWYLYPTEFTGLVLIAWFAANFWLSAKANSKMFYVITYTGGIITASLTFLSTGAGLEGEILTIAITAVIYGIGKFGSIKTRNTILPVLNMLFLWTVFGHIQSMLSFAVNSVEISPFLCAAYLPVLLPLFQIAAAMLILIEGAGAWAKEWKFSRTGTAVLSFFSAVTAADAACSFFGTGGTSLALSQETAGSLLALAIICACGTAYRRNWNQYILGVSPVVAAASLALSRNLLGYEPILPALLAAALVIPSIFRRDWYVKAAAVLLYLAAFNEIFAFRFTDPPNVPLYTGLFLLMAVPVLNYVLIYRKKDGLLPELEQFGGILFTALVFRKMTVGFGGCDMLWAAVLTALLLGHRYFVFGKQRFGGGNERDLVKILLTAADAWICLCCYTAGGLFMPSVPDRIIASVLLVLYSALFTYRAINSQTAAIMILSVVFSHFNLFFITDMWHTGNANILVSCFGLLLSAVLIGIGFWRKEETIRAAGLSTMIIYVFKIALLDIAQTGNMGRRVLVLLLGGVVCFGVSFAYNKLDKLYGNVEESASETK